MNHDPKALATLQARAALAGHTCHVDGAGRIVLARRGRSMSFASLGEAEDWLSKVTGGNR